MRCDAIVVHERDLNTATAIYDDLSREVYCIMGIPIDAIEMPGVLERIDTAALAATPYLISTPNLNFMVTSQTDPQFRDSLLLSDLCPPDGMPIIWIARILGLPIKRRTAGSDMFEALKTRSRLERPLKIFLFGSTEQIAAEVARRLNSAPSGLRCVGWLCPGFGDVDALSEDQFFDEINASGADFLMAALGAKNGQLWLQRNHWRLQVPVRVHLGATINFQAGSVKRAPHIMRKLGLEWLWRIKEEPSLFWRYWHDGGVFVTLLFSHILPLAIRAHSLNVWAGRCRQDFVIFPVQKDDDNVTVSLVGYATASRVPEAILCFRQAVASQKPIVVDLSRTRTIDARFFGLLLMLRKQLKRTGSTLQFQGVSSRLHGLFRLNALEYLLSSG
jgi:N-acetylglucosaminyldiphosphoundecaprenol N-acetyl-beta-D-mannosaminyltransferase